MLKLLIQRYIPSITANNNKSYNYMSLRLKVVLVGAFTINMVLGNGHCNKEVDTVSLLIGQRDASRAN